MTERIYPELVLTHLSPNQSSRSDRIKLIVLHDTESHNRPGKADLAGLGDWFGSTGAGVSAHYGVDGDGHTARYVHDERKAWHCAGYNSPSVGIEQIGFSTDTHAIWEHRGKQIHEVARLIALLSIRHGVPIRRGRVASGHVLRTGVTTHRQLGAIGGNHNDPGTGYPMAHVLDLARHYKRLIQQHRKEQHR